MNLYLVLVFVAGLGVGISTALLWPLKRRQATDVPASTKPEANNVEAIVAAERERIYADLHDDLGAKLLQIVYEAPNAELADVARASLQDLRDVVSRARGCTGKLSETLGEIETEARTRLRGAKIELDWQIKEIADDIELDRGQTLHLFRIVREAISNAIRHAQAQRLKVRVMGTAKQLHLDISDDGVGLETNDRGRGMSNMRNRAEQLAGKITWNSASIGGTRVLLHMPLHTQASP